MRRKLHTVLLSVLMAVVTALGLGAVAAAPAQAVTKNFTLLSWNMCGSQKIDWNCVGFGGPDQKIATILTHVQEKFVNGLVLQEVCVGDLNSLMGQLGTAWRSSFVAYKSVSASGTVSTTTCGEGATGRKDAIGTAIVIKGQLTAATNYTMPHPPSGLRRPFHCVTAPDYNSIRVCNVHLFRGGEYTPQKTWDWADDQLAAIKSALAPYAGNVIFGGDFNVQPPFSNGSRLWVWPAGFYATGAGQTGWRECDEGRNLDTHRPTPYTLWDMKLDYIFSSETKRWCGVAQPPRSWSDHAVIMYSVAVN